MENQNFYLRCLWEAAALLTKMLRLLACYSSPSFYSKLQPALANHPNNELQPTKETLPTTPPWWLAS